MPAPRKTAQLQIRVTTAQKAALQRAARRAGQDVSAFVLARALSSHGQEFQSLARECGDEKNRSYGFAELNTFLTGLGPADLRSAVEDRPHARLSDYEANYVAALVEAACVRLGCPVPEWTSRVPLLDAPVFGSTLLSLRLYLLTNSPAPFRRRNIFVDSSIGDRV